jgi:para-aminobenzoate synthetase component 1
VKLTTQQFSFSDYTIFKNQMLNWANRFNIFCFLDNNGYQTDNTSFSCILAAGTKRSLELKPGIAFKQLKSFYDADPSWLFGHLGYGLKNEVESLKNTEPATVDFGIGFFFEPEFILKITGNVLRITSGNLLSPEEIFNEIIKQPGTILPNKSSPVHVQSSISKESYIAAIEALQQHIKRGDCYEINFCQQFFGSNTVIDPLYVYDKLVEHSPNPFGALYKLNDKYCLCASPERYLKKSGQVISSQPIKGTSRRSLFDKEKDEANKKYLEASAKEKSENVMVVDLVRNDLSRICEEGSVHVKELFGIYSFPQVHQMISTIEGLVKKEVHFTEAIKATFPMGSMTGAPKKRVMELIDQYETNGRGLFSGSIGYITPGADFDFNVVIRSIFYDASKSYLSFSAGGGITVYSNAEDEYTECNLKAEAIRNVLNDLS